jgi:hypothetical protein
LPKSKAKYTPPHDNTLRSKGLLKLKETRVALPSLEEAKPLDVNGSWSADLVRMLIFKISSPEVCRSCGK